MSEQNDPTFLGFLAVAVALALATLAAEASDLVSAVWPAAAQTLECFVFVSTKPKLAGGGRN